MPAQVDQRGLIVADIVHELVDQADPLVEVGVLDGVAVVGTAERQGTVLCLDTKEERCYACTG